LKYLILKQKTHDNKQCLLKKSQKKNLTFVESHKPTKLISYLKEDRGWAVEKRSARIYIVTGDIVQIQIIDTLREQRKFRDQKHISSHGANTPIAFIGSYLTPTCTLTLEQVFIDVGWTAKWEDKKALKIAKSLIASGLRPEEVAKHTELPLAKVKALLKTTAKAKIHA
jgi:hypothetical protein